LKYFEQVKESDEKKKGRISERLMKLNGAFKFIDYKYTAADVAVYSEAIKVLDGFSGFYINDYLNNLAVIINNLLQEVNMSVKFSEQKEFIKVKNGEQEMDFDQLSSGQKTFLSAVFKLSILLHKGVTETLILADEGLGNLDKSNLEKFIKVCEKLQYQIIVIYQNIEDLTGIKTINVVRQKGESKING
jgi:DNA repair exonuclease SbcCD ATPase subunit